jgi:hypothetical protein
MKLSKHLLTAFFIYCSMASSAQSEMPSGFSKGSIVLSDGTTINGFLKDNLKKDASIQYISIAGAKKIKYTGTDINAAEIGGTNFICIKGDFFKLVCKGEICFLQKASDASGIPVYNGSEAIFTNGTVGKPGDYFLYVPATNELKKVSKNTIGEITASSFAGCNAAIEKAKTIKDDMGTLKEAVDIYNSRNK